MSTMVEKIGLALSGGGFRAAVYHLGVLARLADDNLLEKVTVISSVSGGSLGTGLVFTLNHNRWPTSQEYRTTIVPKAYKRLTTQDLQSNLIWRFIYACATLQCGALLTRAGDFANMLRQRWEIRATLSDLPDHPRWYINATCYESGKDWRFTKDSAGDYRFGYTTQTSRLRLCDALAASGAVPGLVGAWPLDITKFEWQPQGHSAASHRLTPRDFPTIHLWDGGVYDNNGLEVFHDFDQPRWQQGVEFLIVSDASGEAKAQAYGIGVNALFRMMTGVMMQQIRALRARAVVALMRKPDASAPGVYLPISNTLGEKLALFHPGPNEIAGRLSPEVVARTEELELQIRRLKSEEFYTLFRHGFEVADFALSAHHPDKFEHIGYGQSSWPDIVRSGIHG